MLELRLMADTKRIAAMVAAVRRECRRAHCDPDHAQTVALVAEQLVADHDAVRGRSRAERRCEVLVVVTVQSDATMLMVRDSRPDHSALGDHLRQLLDGHSSRWSTICGRDGRTTLAEIARTSIPEPAREEAAAVGNACRPERQARASVWNRPIGWRLGAIPPLAPSD